MAIASDTLAHGAVKFGKRIAANALLFIRGNIGAVDITGRRRETQPARQRCAAGCGVTGSTVRRFGNIFARRHGISRTAYQQQNHP